MSTPSDASAAPSVYTAGAFGPLGADQRSEVLDVVRGFALCGVLLANLPWWSGDHFLSPEQQAGFASARWDTVLRTLLLALVELKFIGLFSVLFGMGLALQMRRIDARGVRPWSLLGRRLAILLLLGAAHAWGLWFNDILRFYALWGVVLLPFTRASNRTLIVVGLVCAVLAPGAWYGMDIWLQTSAAPAAGLDARTLRVFSSGTYLEMVKANWAYDWHLMASHRQWAFQVSLFGRLLLGVWAGRVLLFTDIERHRALLQRLAVVGGIIGVLGNGLFAVLAVLEDRGVLTYEDTWLAWMPLPIHAGILGLTAAYGAGLVLVFVASRGRMLKWLAPVGRMALTHYIVHTVIGTWLFYGWLGPALIGQLGLMWILPMWGGIVLFQVAFSHLWLKHFQFGPLEWLWRSLAYWRWQAFLR